MIQGPQHVKTLIEPLRTAMYDFAEAPVRATLHDLLADDCAVHMCHPFGDMVGPTALYDAAFRPLFQAAPDLERRDLIVIDGTTDEGARWAGACGYYTGTFAAPFLGIPPTGHQFGLRFHEFFREENGQIVEMQLIWDLPSLMMQASAWPMVPSLGREWQVPGPSTQDGLRVNADPEAALRNKQTVIDMLITMSRHPREGGPEIMQLEKFWHPRMNWYGPSGIGTARGIKGFRHWHQIPFLNALPDRHGGTSDVGESHFFAEGDYVAVTGWPNMAMTVTGDGWLGIAPAGQAITMRSLDFWRLEDGMIRENWVLVDLLDVYAQLGVDVLARMNEFNKVRSMAPVALAGGV
jgi:predicted ester cyclase